MSHPLSGLRPELNLGIRPEPHDALNTVAILRCGVAITVSPNPQKRANWSSSLKRAHRLTALVSDPCLREVASCEDDICYAIEDGRPVNGFVGFVRLAGGSIKAIPDRGQPFVASNARVLARIIDRGLNGPQSDPLTLLGLNDPPRPAKLAKPSKPVNKRSAWRRVNLSDLRA